MKASKPFSKSCRNAAESTPFSSPPHLDARNRRTTNSGLSPPRPRRSRVRPRVGRRQPCHRPRRLGPVGRAQEHGKGDLLAEVIPPARKRSVSVFAQMEESFYNHVRHLPNFIHVSEIDLLGRRTGTSCLHHPDYRAWWLSVVEDYCRSYTLDGIAFCSERTGPSGDNAQRRKWTLLRLLSRPRAQTRRFGKKRERPSDGWFVAYWRLLIPCPDRPRLGTPLDRKSTFSVPGNPRRSQSHFSESPRRLAYPPRKLVQAVLSSDSGLRGPRRLFRFHQSRDVSHFRGYIHGIAGALLRDFSDEESYTLLCQILGYDDAQGPFSGIARKGFNAEYVRRETLRALAGVGGGCQIWPALTSPRVQTRPQAPQKGHGQPSLQRSKRERRELSSPTRR